jgi:hypothetical protein
LDRPDGRNGRASGDKEERNDLRGERDGVVAGARVVAGERLG